MDIELREPLDEAQFAFVKGCRKTMNEDSPAIKISFLKDGGFELDESLENLIRMYYMFLGARPSEFFEFNGSAALELVNEMLEEDGGSTMEKDVAIEILESDERFRKDIEEAISKRLNRMINEFLGRQIQSAIGKKAFSYEDHEITYEEYRRRIDVLQNSLTNYFIIKDR